LFRNIGSTELILIAAVMLLFFGGRKLPELARGIGSSIKELKSAVKE
jgi:sec-independent protein translocase protein TatA